MPETIKNADTEAVRKINRAVVTNVALRIGGAVAVTVAGSIIANRIEKALDNRSSSN